MYCIVGLVDSLHFAHFANVSSVSYCTIFVVLLILSLDQMFCDCGQNPQECTEHNYYKLLTVEPIQTD